MGNLMKQAQKMQEQMAKTQEKLAQMTVEASSGGGMVTATVNGQQRIVGIKIDPEVADSGDMEMLEDLIVSAVNAAQEKADNMMKEEMMKITGGMQIPGMGF
jgi:DNA-binding YbaB/EbfC family protein